MKTETYIFCNIFCVIIASAAVTICFFCPDDKDIVTQVKQEPINFHCKNNLKKTTN